MLFDLINQHVPFLEYLEFFARIVVACLCGAIIGVERSRRLKEAGVRTHLLVACTASLMMIVSKYGFADLINAEGTFFSGTKGTDPARIAAQVVSGISFLCAGVIFKQGSMVKGLTTAAGLWAAGLVGIALGLGCYTTGLISFVALLCALRWFPSMEVALKNRSNHFEIHLELTNSVSLQDFVTVIRRLGLKIDDIEQNPAYVGSGLSVYTIAISVGNEMLKKYKTHAEIIEALKSLEYVYHIEEMRA